MCIFRLEELWSALENLSESCDGKCFIVALAALAATASFAQSSVTIYGVADVGYKTQKFTDAGVTTTKASGIADGAMAGQRFGFRGTEDLGSGLKANFVIEQGISMTSSTLTNARTATSAPQVEAWGTSGGKSSTSLNRQSYVGLSGGFGEVRLGYQYTNLYELSTLAGFNSGSEGTNGADTAHTHGSTIVGGTRANGVTYITPTFNGFSANLQYGAGTDQITAESTDSALAQTKAERTGLMLNYANGPLNVKLAHTSYKNGSVAALSATTTPTLASTPTRALGVTSTVTGKLTQLGASYNFGPAILAATLNNGDDGAAGADNAKYKSQQIGVKVPVGAFTLIATTGKADVTKNAVKTTDAKQTQFGVNYTLSKRTTAYAYMGNTKDNATGGVDKKSSTIVGLLHSF